ncbi:MAG: hypothetical protein M1814_004651 [Vezdaea aestivalis]|nr:MAG: hypothetical protein M1814_004651 [Vezdaea aestivalis]
MAKYLAFVSLLLLLVSGASALVPFAGEYDDQVVCVYPISGQYGLIPRYLYYALLIFAVFSRRTEWLVAGALASALTYSGSAAIHAFAMIIIRPGSQLDLDAFGALAVCTAGSLASPCLLTWSTTLRDSVARPLVGIYGTFVSIGTVCAGITVLLVQSTESACYSSSGTSLVSKTQFNMTFDCIYNCFATQQALREPSKIVALEAWRLGDRLVILIYITVGSSIMSSLYLGIFSWCLSSGYRRRTLKERRKLRPEKQLREMTAFRLGQTHTNTQERLGAERVRQKAREELETGGSQMIKMGGYSSWLLAFLWPALTTLIEVYILAQGGLPFDEKVYSVGQWSACTIVVLAIMGSAIVHFYEPKHWAKQVILDKELKEAEDRKHSASTQQSGDAVMSGALVNDVDVDIEQQV